MNKLPLISLAAAALLTLASFDAPAAQWTGVAQREGAPVTLDELQQARWIADGRDDAPRKVYVFLDANCIYCAKFWADARPWVDSGKVQLRYLMVAVIYLCMSLPLSRLTRHLESRMGKGKAAGGATR